MPDQIITAVKDAIASNSPVQITGGESKSFYGYHAAGTELNVSRYQGIVSYEPTELVVTARCGTPLIELESLLAEHQQVLPFEPPHFARSATVGGTVACGLSGPRRPYTGSVRDFILGVRMINGKGEDLTFGGQVMKNVAGFDVSRLMVGALGTLGIILEVSIKLLPKSDQEITLQFECDQAQALVLMNRWAGQGIPLSATCFEQGSLVIRLSGFPAALRSAQQKIGGLEMSDADHFWYTIREQEHAFFSGSKPLWRIAVPPATGPLNLEGETLIEWGGAQRWLRTDLPAEIMRVEVSQHGGHATLFRNADNKSEIFSPLSPAMKTIHQRLKQSFDPQGIFNPGKMYPDL